MPVWSLGGEDSPGEGNGNPLQYSCLENPMDRGARWPTVHGVAKSWTRLSDQTHSTHSHFYLLQCADCTLLSNVLNKNGLI